MSVKTVSQPLGDCVTTRMYTQERGYVPNASKQCRGPARCKAFAAADDDLDGTSPDRARAQLEEDADTDAGVHANLLTERRTPTATWRHQLDKH